MVCRRTGRPSGIRPKSVPTTEAVVGRPAVAQPPSQPPATGRTAAAARCRRASRRDREGAFMGIGGDDYSHRSDQRSSLRELSEVERGQRRSGVGHGHYVAKASGGWAIRVGSALQRTVDGANPRALNSTTSPLSNLGASQDRKATATDAGKQAAGKHSRRSRPCPWSAPCSTTTSWQSMIRER